MNSLPNVGIARPSVSSIGVSVATGTDALVSFHVRIIPSNRKVALALAVRAVTFHRR